MPVVRRRLDGVIAFAVPAMGLLESTAIVNLSDTQGVPLAAAAVPVLIGRLAYDRPALAALWAADRVFRFWVRALSVFLLCLWIGGGIHALGFGLNPAAQLSQCVSRSVWPVYLASAIAFYRITGQERTLLRAVLAFGTVYVLYGFYDLAAQFFGLPRFLDWVRNNNSIYVSRVSSGGWIDLPRITSLAGEPAFTTVPILLSSAAAIVGLRGRLRVFAVTLCVLFVIGTAARGLWLTAIGALLAAGTGAIWRGVIAPRIGSSIERPLLLAFGATVPIVLLMLRLSIDATDSDVSIQERQESTVAGYELFRASPLTGLGFDAKSVYYRNYANQLYSYDIQPSIIHNGLVAYLSSLGVLGYLMFEIPLIVLATHKGLSIGWRLYWITVVIMGMQAGDLSWTTSFWAMLLFVALQPAFAKKVSASLSGR